MPRALRWIGAAVALVAATWVGGADGVDLRPWAVALGVAMLVAALVVRARHGGLAVDAPRVALGALVVWNAVLAVTLTVPPSDAAAVVATGAVAWGLCALVADWRARAWACGAVAGLGACSGLLLVVGRWIEGVRSDGLLGNPNLSASVALLGLASTPFVRLPVAARWTMGAASALGILASGSRASVLGLAAVAVAWLLTGPARRLARLAAAAVLVIGLGVLAVRLAADRDPLRWERVRIWGVALQVARDHLPWGTGPAGFADAAVSRNFPHLDRPARYGLVPDLAESDLLQLAATVGVPGVGLAAWLALALVQRARRAGPHAWGCLVALAVTSAFHTQLPVPVVAWTATLALAAAVPGTRRRRTRAGLPTVLACGMLAGTLVAVAIVQPAWWLGGRPDDHLTAARALAAAGPKSDPRLADAEALASRAVALRPGWGEGWRVLGALRAARAFLRDDARLWAAARDDLTRARSCNPLDALAALELGRTQRALGAAGPARAAFRAAVGLEPNLVGAWLELALLDVEQGRVEAARGAFDRAERALAARPGQPTPYEEALSSFDPSTLARLAATLREAR